MFSSLQLVEPPLADVSPALRSIAKRTVAAYSNVFRILCEAHCEFEDRTRPANEMMVTHASAKQMAYLEIQHHAGPETPTWQDTHRKKAWWKDGSSLMLNEFDRIAHIKLEKNSRERSHILYAECVGWRCPDDPPSEYMNPDKPLRLIDLFAAERLASLKAKITYEEVNAQRCICISIDNGTDRLWISPQFGNSLVRRITTLPTAPEYEFEYNGSDFRWVSPSFAMPYRVTSEYRHRVSKTMERRNTMTVSRMLVNDQLDESIFTPKLPPGTHVFGQDGHLAEAVPNGEDLLDHWASVVVARNPPKLIHHGGNPVIPPVIFTIGTLLMVSAGLIFSGRIPLPS